MNQFMKLLQTIFCFIITPSLFQDEMFNMDDISDVWGGGGTSPMSDRRGSTESRPRVRKKQERSPPVVAPEDKPLLPGIFTCTVEPDLRDTPIFSRKIVRKDRVSLKVGRFSTMWTM